MFVDDFLFVVSAAERVGKGFALLGEGCAHKVEESVGGRERIGLGRKEHGGAIHIGPGRKMLGANLAENLRVGIGGHQNREAPIIAAAGACTNALGNFELHHSHEALGQMQFRHEPCDNRSRHVVGQVSRDPGLFVGIQKRLQVKLQKINVFDVEILAALEFFLQKFHALLVDFDGSELHGALNQVLRQGAVPRADFKHPVARIRRQIARNHLRGRYIQKILAKFTAAGSIHTAKDRNKKPAIQLQAFQVIL